MQAFRKKVQKTDTEGQTDRRTGRQRECKPIVPFGLAGRGLISFHLIKYSIHSMKIW